MYSRRLRIAAATGRRKTTFNTAKKIAKLISCTTSVPSTERNDMALALYLTSAEMIAGTFATTSRM